MQSCPLGRPDDASVGLIVSPLRRPASAASSIPCTRSFWHSAPQRSACSASTHTSLAAVGARRYRCSRKGAYLGLDSPSYGVASCVLAQHRLLAARHRVWALPPVLIQARHQLALLAFGARPDGGGLGNEKTLLSRQQKHIAGRRVRRSHRSPNAARTVWT